MQLSEEAREAKEMALGMMNDNFIGLTEDMCAKFGGFTNPQNVKMTDITEDGMYIACDEGEVFVPFEKKAELTVESLRDEVINIVNSMEN